MLGESLPELRRAGQVVETLAGEPLTLYRELWDAERALHLESSHHRSPFPGLPINGKTVLRRTEIPGLDGGVARICDALAGWAEHWQLRVEWPLTRALWALAKWSEFPKVLERRAWAEPEYEITVPVRRYLVPEWDGTESFSVYEQRERERLSSFDKYFARPTGGGDGPRRSSVNAMARAYRARVRTQSLHRVTYPSWRDRASRERSRYLIRASSRSHSGPCPLGEAERPISCARGTRSPDTDPSKTCDQSGFSPLLPHR